MKFIVIHTGSTELGVMCKEAMNRIFNDIEVTIRDESTYSRNSTDNACSYNNEYCRNNEYEHISAIGLIVGDIENPDTSSILLGVGGATSIDENAVAFNNQTIFVASGDAVFALSFPELELKWCKKVDFATCFGVYFLPKENCLITWGELNVSRLTETGEEIWSVSGPDIFTEGFEISNNKIKLIDFNNDEFIVNIETGDIVQTNT